MYVVTTSHKRKPYINVSSFTLRKQFEHIFQAILTRLCDIFWFRSKIFSEIYCQDHKLCVFHHFFKRYLVRCFSLWHGMKNEKTNSWKLTILVQFSNNKRIWEKFANCNSISARKMCIQFCELLFTFFTIYKNFKSFDF